MINWLKDGLSVDETRFSSLVISYFLVLGFTLYKYTITGDISDNILTLLGYQMMGITGVNVADKFLLMSKKKEKVDE